MSTYNPAPLTDDFMQRIARVSSKHAALISYSLVSHSSEELFFYKRCRLWRFHVGAPADQTELRYLDDGIRLIHLDGAVDQIYEANQSMVLMLKDDNLAAYLRFFFDNVGGGELHVVESVEDLKQVMSFEMADAAARQIADKAFKTVKPMVVSDDATNRWEVSFLAVWDKLLLNLEVHLILDGTVAPVNKTLVMSLAQQE
jgi:hypothetical protein